MPDNPYDVALEQVRFTIGEPVWTYSRRFSENPTPVEGVVLGWLKLEGHYPPIKYIVGHNSILCLRDDYTMARELHDVRVHITKDMSNTCEPGMFQEHTYDD